MKLCIILMLFIANNCFSQGWEAEVMAGAAGYKGDLTQKAIPLNTLKPGANINLKYNFDNSIILRAGISWLTVEGDDKYNTQANLKNRNLNFKSTVWEANICVELNLVEPDLYYSYPYLFAGVGIFHFDPYTYDKDNQKTFLQPLGTEGQGIAGYPNRKPYSLAQLCLPVGGGWKYRINNRYDLVYEFGYRLLFTDYLDDVSTTYISSPVLVANNGAKSAELAYRTKQVPDSDLPHEGDVRGNSKIKDGYFFSGLKLTVHFGKNKKF